MWWKILKIFWFSGWSRSGKNPAPLDRTAIATTMPSRPSSGPKRARNASVQKTSPPGHSHAAGQGSIDPRHTHAQGQPRTPPSRPGGEWRGHEPGAATAANQDLERPRRARAARRFPFSARGDTGASDSAASVSPAAADRRTCPFASVAGAPGGGHWIGICRDSWQSQSVCYDRWCLVTTFSGPVIQIHPPFTWFTMGESKRKTEMTSIAMQGLRNGAAQVVYRLQVAGQAVKGVNVLVKEICHRTRRCTMDSVFLVLRSTCFPLSLVLAAYPTNEKVFCSLGLV